MALLLLLLFFANKLFQILGRMTFAFQHIKFPLVPLPDAFCNDCYSMSSNSFRKSFSTAVGRSRKVLDNSSPCVTSSRAMVNNRRNMQPISTFYPNAGNAARAMKLFTCRLLLRMTAGQKRNGGMQQSAKAEFTKGSVHEVDKGACPWFVIHCSNRSLLRDCSDHSSL
jgi:hypothetical protein